MNIPKYVIEVLSRSEYDFRHTSNPNYGAGYTIRISKSSHYTYADTLRKEAERLVAWANRVAGCEIAYLLYAPEKTRHYAKQAAVVTIFDPVMQKIEQYIPTH